MTGLCIFLECRANRLTGRLDGIWGVRDRKEFRMTAKFLLDRWTNESLVILILHLRKQAQTD